MTKRDLQVHACPKFEELERQTLRRNIEIHGELVICNLYSGKKRKVSIFMIFRGGGYVKDLSNHLY